MMQEWNEKEKAWNEILTIFGRLPKPNINPTFMDICRMGGDRFEERCSQVLKFYFSPNEPHKLRGLFLDSLLERLGVSSDYDPRAVRVSTEETTEDGKRIDITITSPEKFVIAIENKIEAELYNPLESYAKHINQNYGNEVKKLVVLSVRKITDAETEEMKKHGFVYLNYQDLFSTIKTNLGKYAIDCDQAYLAFLFDFIRTIEKKFNYSTTMEQDRFFFEKQTAIEELIQHYNSFKDAFAKKRFDAQKGPIDKIKAEISARTNANWWVWEDGWVVLLGIKFNEESNCIGIECNFGDATLDNPLGEKFYIFITVWNKKCFTPYEKELKSEFSNATIEYDDENDRINLRLPCIDSNKHTEIIEKLEKYYKIMKELTDEIK